MFYLLHFWLPTLHSMKSHYNSKVQTYHCSTCIKYIYLYQNWVRNQYDTVCTTLVKIDVLNTYGVMICSYFGIIFFLFFKKIENAFYTSFKYSLSKIDWILFSNAKETLQKMLARKCSYRYHGKHRRIDNKCKLLNHWSYPISSSASG